MSRYFAALVGAAAAVAALPGAGTAQGFAVNEHGSCAMGRAGTGVAMPCNDGSGIWSNPAGIAGQKGFTLSGGLTIIDALGSFTDDLQGRKDDLDNDPIPVPHLYFVAGVTDKVSAGIGLFAPYGLGTKWKTSFEGRFSGYDNSLQSIYIQPTVAIQATDRIQVGVGFDFVVGFLELNQRADLSEFTAAANTTFGMLGIPFHTDFADANLDANGATGAGAHFGVIVKASDAVTFGARYLTRVTLDYDGKAKFKPIATNIVLPPGNPLAIALGLDPTTPLPLDAVLNQNNLFAAGAPLGTQGVKASITMPDQATVGVAFKAAPTLDLLFDLQWINWSEFDAITIDFENAVTPDRTLRENYDDTYAIRTGFEWAAKAGLAIRGGYLFHNGAAPDETVTPLLPEGSRNEVTLGVGFPITPKLSVSLAYQHIQQNDRRGRVREAPAGSVPTKALNSGLYEFSGNLFGTTFIWHF
ncbi:MAG: OmpP1/FadL family transporter [Gemmatimonadales bacterium]